jgi:hypothetical protein
MMPIAEYSDKWGYNPRQLMAVHGPYGSPDDLRRLIDRAHTLGMAVIVDVVCKPCLGPCPKPCRVTLYTNHTLAWGEMLPELCLRPSPKPCAPLYLISVAQGYYQIPYPISPGLRAPLWRLVILLVLNLQQ